MASPLLAIMTPEGWQPGIGDPTVMGWFTVIGYLIASVLCSRRVRIVAAPGPAIRRRHALIFWASLALLLIALGVNKQLDLQTWLTAFGRSLAREQNWYEHRRLVQVVFIIFLVMGLIGMWIAMARRISLVSGRVRFALLGAFILTAFVIMRATSFHHMDALLGMKLAGAKINWIFELSGIACVALASGWRTHQSPSDSPGIRISPRSQP